jgi:hypothetical protein
MKATCEKGVQRQKALTVGVNIFQKTFITRLSGCVNDALDIRSILKTYFNFTNTDIHVLTDARGNKGLIFDRLNMLSKWAMPGDLVVFSYSAHGSQLRDRNGDELSDHMDELFCPYDMDWDKGTYILDDEMAQVCAAFRKGVTFEVLMDTCHSATMLRNPVDKEMLKYQIKPRYTPPPLDLMLRAEGEEKDLCPTKKIMRSLSITDKVLWAACKSNQTSADAYFNGRYNGAFTFFFCQAIKKAKGKITRRALISQVRKSLTGAGFDQIPQLEGTKSSYDKNVFSI